MNYDKLQNLVDKYFNGETTLEEESELRNYFLTASEVPKELLPLKEQFLALEQISSWKLDNSFDERIMNEIKNSNVSSNRLFAVFSKHSSEKSLFSYAITAIAASVLILFSIFSSIDHFKNNNNKSMGQNINTDLVLKQTTDALNLLAVNFDKGLLKAQRVARPLNNSLYALGNINKVGKGIKTLQPVSELSKMKIIKNNK